MEIRASFRDESFQYTYKEGVLRVKLHPRLSAYDIKPGWNMQEDAAALGFEFHLEEELGVLRPVPRRRRPRRRLLPRRRDFVSTRELTQTTFKSVLFALCRL